MSHNILAPSAAHRWTTCTASIPETLGAIDESSEYADDGTASHTMASYCLQLGCDAKDYPNATINVYEDDMKTVRRVFKADDERKSFVQVYLDAIRDRLHEGATLLVEQRLNSGLQSMLYGPSEGTGDATIIAPQFKLIEIHDLKYGMGIRVEVNGNEQLMDYGLGAINLAESLGYKVDDWQVRMVIHQPRLDSMTDHDMTVRDLRAWGASVQATLDAVDRGETKYAPSDGACRWCPKKATCTALAQYVSNTIASEFPPVPDMTEWGIGKALERVLLVEQWTKAVRAAGWAALNAGTKIPGWKLVAGRQGNREWTDKDAVEDIFKNRYRFNQEEMYKPLVLMSPTDAEKRMKKVNPQRWEDMQSFIKRAPGALTMVRDGDERATHDLSNEMAQV